MSSPSNYHKTLCVAAQAKHVKELHWEVECDHNYISDINDHDFFKRSIRRFLITYKSLEKLTFALTYASVIQPRPVPRPFSLPSPNAIHIPIPDPVIDRNYSVQSARVWNRHFSTHFQLIKMGLSVTLSTHHKFILYYYSFKFSNIPYKIKLKPK